MTTHARTATLRPFPSAVVRGSLRDGLLVCLGLLATDPERFEGAAVVWHRRWCAAQTEGVEEVLDAWLERRERDS